MASKGDKDDMKVLETLSSDIADGDKRIKITLEQELEVLNV